MLLHESVKRCPTCGELTPHSRRVVALPVVFGVAAPLLAAWCFYEGGFGWVVGGLLSAAAVVVVLRDRERYWYVRCERCRGRKRRELLATKPGLGRNTEINLP